MKLAVIGIVVFVACLAGVTLATRPRAVASPAPTAARADSGAGAATRPDSAHTGADTLRADTPRADTPGPATPASAPAADTAANPNPPAAKPAAPRLPAAPVTPDRSELYHRLSRIFTNMKAEDAAGVMAKLTDDEVVGILTQLGARQAASLLSALPKDRAAILSHRLLRPDTASHS